MRLLVSAILVFVLLNFWGCASNKVQLNQTNSEITLDQKTYLLTKHDWRVVEKELRLNYEQLLTYGDYLTGTSSLARDKSEALKVQSIGDMYGILNNCPINLENYHLVNCIGCWFKMAFENASSPYYEVNENGNRFFKTISEFTLDEKDNKDLADRKTLLEYLYFTNSCDSNPDDIVMYRMHVLDMFADNLNLKSSKSLRKVLASIKKQEDNSILLNRIESIY